MAIKINRGLIIISVICLLVRGSVLAAPTLPAEEAVDAEPETAAAEEITNSNTLPALREEAATADDEELANNIPLASENAASDEDSEEVITRDRRGWPVRTGVVGGYRTLGGLGYDNLGTVSGIGLGGLSTGYGVGLGGLGTGYGIGYGGISLGTGAIRVPAHGGAIGRTTLLKSYRSRTDPIVRSRIDYVPRRVTVTGQRHVTVPYFRRVTTRVTNLGPGNAHVRKVETGERHAPVAGGSRSFYQHLGTRIAPTIAVKGAVAPAIAPVVSPAVAVAPVGGVGYVGGVRRVGTVAGKVW